MKLAASSFVLCLAVAAHALAQTPGPSAVFDVLHIKAAPGTPERLEKNPKFVLEFNVEKPAATHRGTVTFDFPATFPPATIDAQSFATFASPVRTAVTLKSTLTTKPGSNGKPVVWAFEPRLAIHNTYGNWTTCAKRGTTVYTNPDVPGTYSIEVTVDCTWTKLHTSAFSFLTDVWIDVAGGNNDNFLSFDGSANYTYTPPLPVDLAFERMEVVQVVQDANNTLPLVVDKDTVARVFVRTNQGVPNVTGSLRAFRDGVELAGSPIRPANASGRIAAIAAPQRRNTDESLNFRLPDAWVRPGKLTLRATINDGGAVTETTTSNNTGELQVEFHQTPTLTIEYLRVCLDAYAFAPCPTPAIAASSTLLPKLFPVASDGFFYNPHRVPEWHWSKPFDTEADTKALLVALRKRYEIALAGNGVAPDQLVGWTGRASPVALGWADARWDGDGQGRVFYAFDDSRAVPSLDENLATFAHEAAHNYGLRHTNTPDCNGCVDHETDWPSKTSGRTGEVGFDVAAMTAKSEFHFDVMTYQTGRLLWISPFHYRKLFNSKLVPQLMARIAPHATQEQAVISGWAMRDGSGGGLDPLVKIESSAPVSVANSGNHCVRFRGASGGALAQACFNLTFETPDDEPMDRDYFALRVPLPAGTTSVVLVRGEAVLATLAGSARAPQVTITSPSPGETWSGVRGVAWTASDPDNDALTYTLMYSSDGGGSWRTIATDLNATRFDFLTAELKAGAQTHFRVIASDGINTATATVGPVTVVAAPLVDLPPFVAFGPIDVGGSATGKVIIANRGEKELRVTSLQSNNAEFTVGATTPVVVPPLSHRTIDVTFRPTAPGVRNARLTLATDDPARATTTVSLFGEVTYPAATLTATSPLDFGSTAPNAPVERTLTLQNHGATPVRVASIASTHHAFTVPNFAPLVIAPGAAANVTVRFSSARSGAAAGKLVVASNGAPNVISVDVRGTVTGSATSTCSYAFAQPVVSAAASGASGTVDLTTNCAWTATAPSWIAITPASGSGNRALAYSVAANPGTSARVGTITANGASLTIVQSGASSATQSVIAAVGSTPGGSGSFFRTSMQLYNPYAYPITLTGNYHAQLAPGTASDPEWQIALAPLSVVSIDDLLPTLGLSGLGTLDLTAVTGPLPILLARIYNDAGANGTAGMSEEQLRPEDALQPGQTGVLLAPPDTAAARFNLGLRTLASETSVVFDVYDASGNKRFSVARTFAPLYFIQQNANGFFGQTLGPNDAIHATVTSGAAVLYGATTDNKTQDPSLQIAAKIASLTNERAVVPVVGSGPGNLGSFFRTGMQLHNPTAATIRGKLVFHRAATSGNDNDPSVPYELAPHATLRIADFVPLLGLSGLGSVDVIPSTGARPLTLGRVFNDAGANGTTGMTETAVALSDLLQAGERAVLLTPADAAQARFNIGVRSGPSGAELDVVARDDAGRIVASVRKTYAANFFEQVPADLLAGAKLPQNAAITFHVVAGSAVVYGASTDNKTQDPSLQLATRVNAGPPPMRSE